MVLFDFFSKTSPKKPEFVDNLLDVIYEPMLKTSNSYSCLN